MTRLTPSLWIGRIDQEEEPELALRWHQKVKPFDPGVSTSGIALVGFASDEGVRRNQGRPGAAEGPEALRQVLANLPWHGTEPVWDAGTLSCINRQLEQAQSQYAQTLTRLLSQGLMPIGLGGGHEIAWGSYQGLIRHLEEQQQASDSTPIRVGIINFDAHFDLRLPNNGPSSGTPFWQIAQYAKQKGHPFSYMCLGVSHCSNTRALFKRANDLGVIYKTDQEMSLLNLDELMDSVQAYLDSIDHLYLTIDLDVFPAAQVPGVSAPAARGVGLEVVEPLLQLIKDSGKISLFDVAELNPAYDMDSRSARVGARLIHLLTSDNR